MTDPMPIHALRDYLHGARLLAITTAAEALGTSDTLHHDHIRHIALLQGALHAVQDEIAAHEPHVGHGSETPLQ